MISLILNEFKKIFSKKSIYIIFLVIILLILSFNLLDKYSMKFFDEYAGNFGMYETKEEIENRIEEIEKSGFRGLDNTQEEWMFLKGELQKKDIVEKLDEKGKDHEWKKEYVYSDSGLAEYSIKIIEKDLTAIRTKDKSILKSVEYLNLKDKYEKEVDKFVNMSEEEYTERTIKEIKENIKESKKEITNLEKEEKENKEINNGELIKQLQKDIKELEHQLDVAQIRKEKKIPYDYKNYMSQALTQYNNIKLDLEDKKENLEKNEDERPKQEYYTMLKDFKEAEYILENEQDINNMTTANYSIKTFLSSTILLYIIILIVISGTIVSDEYSKGTIKNLLVKPYKRTTILLSKLIVVLIMIIFSFLILFSAQVFISAIIYDTETILDPVVEYNVKAEEIQKFNLFYYVFREYIYTLPYILVFVLFAFAVSTITTSTAAAVTLGMTSFMASNIVNQILTTFTPKWMKYVPTIYWHWYKFISPDYNASLNLDFKVAIIVTVVTWFIFLIPTFILFKKKDIKNI